MAPGNSQSVRLAFLTVFSRSCHLPLSLSFHFLSYTCPYPQRSLSVSTWFNPKRQLSLLFSLIDTILFYILFCYDEISQARTHAHAQTHTDDYRHQIAKLLAGMRTLSLQDSVTSERSGDRFGFPLASVAKAKGAL